MHFSRRRLKQYDNDFDYRHRFPRKKHARVRVSVCERVRVDSRNSACILCKKKLSRGLHTHTRSNDAFANSTLCKAALLILSQPTYPPLLYQTPLCVCVSVFVFVCERERERLCFHERQNVSEKNETEKREREFLRESVVVEKGGRLFDAKKKGGGQNRHSYQFTQTA
jgi:hypothetical protein